MTPFTSITLLAFAVFILAFGVFRNAKHTMIAGYVLLALFWLAHCFQAVA